MKDMEMFREKFSLHNSRTAITRADFEANFKRTREQVRFTFNGWDGKSYNGESRIANVYRTSIEGYEDVRFVKAGKSIHLIDEDSSVVEQATGAAHPQALWVLDVLRAERPQVQAREGQSETAPAAEERSVNTMSHYEEERLRIQQEAKERFHNPYFEDMERIGREYDAAKRIREAEKEEIIRTKGWDSEELRTWYECEEQFVFPFTMGNMKAYWAWMNSIDNASSELEIADTLFESETADFSDTLKAAGCKTIVFTTQSTALMENMHNMVKLGWTMTGLCTITRTENHYRTFEAKPILGVRFSICQK